MNDFYSDPLYLFRDLRRVLVIMALAAGKATIQAVASHVQIPYVTAARILRELHERGIVGCEEFSESRRPGAPHIEYHTVITEIELHASTPGHMRVRANVGGTPWDSGWMRGMDG